MNFLKGIIKTIDTIVDRVSHVIAYLTIVILAAITIEVVMRRVFSSPTVFTYELIVMSFAAYVILIAAYGYQKGCFVCVDLFSAKFKPVTSRVVMLLTSCIFFIPFIAGILPASLRFFLRSYASQEHSWSQWSPIIWPVKLAMLIGLIMLFAQGISEMLKSIIWLIDYRQNKGLGEE